MLKLPGYRIKEKIYESSRSAIYTAIRNSDAKSVIIKGLLPAYPTPEEIAKFKSEYEILRDLNIDGVIRVYTLEKFENTYQMIMEDFGGIALRDILHSAKIKIKDFLELAIRITEILGELHNAGILHKDINPSNILWNPRSNEVKIIDFGISTKLTRENQEMRNPNILEGTLAYISPEQTGRMNRFIDYRTDFYSFGITLFELLAGSLPFESSDPMELVHFHIARNPATLAELTDSDGESIRIPRVISDIIEKLMAKSPEERYQSTYGLKYDFQKALELYDQSGTIGEFQIGTKDISDIFQIPDKLYGFEEQIQSLLNVYKLANQGSTEIMLVSGDSGAGKSALVNEIYKFMVPGAGYFFRGKYQKFNNDVPYSGFINALGDLVRQLLQESNDDLGRWNLEINKALHPNGKIITDLIPDMVHIIGQQCELDELGPSESLNRFLFTLKNFIKVFADRGYPVVIFLDDLQWSDVASLKLLENLVSADDIKYLFIIGAYRSLEVDAGHPLHLILNEIRKIKNIHELHISPLSKSSVIQIISNTLKSNLETTSDLAEIVFQKTDGNPFFVREFLNNLYNTKVINFDHANGRWNWKIENIQNIKVSDNVVELLNKRLTALDGKTLDLLSLASCLGSIFDFKTLNIISEQSPQNTADGIWEAIKQGIVIPLTGNYRLLHFAPGGIPENTIPELEVIYQFQHDRVRQAAYLLVEPRKKKEVHLKIGWLLLKHINPEKEPEKLLEIIHHLNFGISLIDDKKKREKLKFLNFIASEKARSSSAFIPALQYSTMATELFDDNSWNEDYALTFKINKLHAQCLYLCNQIDLADAACLSLLSHAKTKLEKASIKEMQSIHYNALWKLDDSVRTGIEGLDYLGIKISSKPSMITVLLNLIKVKLALRGKSADQLAFQPTITDPEIKLAMKLLINFIPPSYMSGNGNLFALAILLKTNFALKYGNSPETAAAYIGYAALLAGIGDLKGANDFGKLGIRLSEANSSLEWKCMILNLYALFSVSWNEHWSGLHDIFKRAVDTGLRSGDMLYTAFGAGFLNLWDPSINLKMQIDESGKYLPLIEKTKIEPGLLAAKLMRQKWLNMRGATRDRFSMDDDVFTEKEILKRMMEIKYESGIAIYHLFKVQIHYMYGDYASANNHLKKSDNLMKSLAGSPYMVEYCLYSFLCNTALFSEKNAITKRKSRYRINKEYRRMKKWAQHCPQNFSHYFFLMDAEIARISTQYLKATNYYNKAIEAAEINQFPVAVALCNEIAARFFLEKSQNKIAAFYMKNAWNYYKIQGVVAKTDYLDERHPELLLRENEIETHSIHSKSSGSANTPDSQSKPVDLTTIMKAAAAITGEIVLDRLLDRLMKITIENAGAQVGSLFLYRDINLCLVANGFVDKETSTIDWLDMEAVDGFPKSVIRYVARTCEYLVIADAFSDVRFSKDPHIQRGFTKSILCIPILNLGKAIGILYLENNLVAGSFTNERIGMLQLLSGHIAVSINNAVLYASLDQKVHDRTQELEVERNKLRSRNKTMEHDIALARKIQYNLIPEKPPAWFISTLYKPMQDVGGDFFDFITFENSDNIGIFLSDVSGHGVTAAFITSMIKTIILQAGKSLLNPANLLSYLNEVLQYQTADNFVTVFYGIYDPVKRNLLYSSAGHNQPFILSADGITQLDRGKSLPVAIASNEYLKKSKKAYENMEVTISPESKLLLYTDGFTEATPVQENTMFEEMRMKTFFKENINLASDKFISKLFSDLIEFRGSAYFEDDICLICVDVK